MKKVKIPVRLVKDNFQFESSHRLLNYKGACAKWHGHSYKLSVMVEAIPSDVDGIGLDFKLLKLVVTEAIIDHVDHANLNKVMPRVFKMEGNPTCENMLIAFWYALDHEISERFEGAKLMELKLWETANSYGVLTREMVYNVE